MVDEWVDAVVAVARLLIEIFEGDDLRGDVVFVFPWTSESLSGFTVRRVRLVGDAVFCLFGDLDPAVGTMHVGGDSGNGMILFARAIGYETAIISSGSRSERILWEKSGCLCMIWMG